MDFPDYFVKKYNETENIVDLVKGVENTFSLGLFCVYFTNSSIDLYNDHRGPIAFYNSPVAKDSYKKARQRGVRIRVITEITRENLFYCKQCLGYIDELRHMDGITHMFGVSERHYLSSRLQYDDPQLTESLFSNVKWFVKEQQYFFENLWKKAIPAKQRFREIDLSLKREFIETLRDPVEITELIAKIVTSSSKEILCIVPSFSFLQKLQKEGFVKVLKNHLLKYNLDFKIILNNNSPEAYDEIQVKTEKLKVLFNDDDYSFSQSGNPNRNNQPFVDDFVTSVKIIQKDLSLLTIIVDKELMLSIQINETDKNSEKIKDSIEIATYSNSPSTLYSYLSVFEKLWLGI